MDPEQKQEQEGAEPTGDATPTDPSDDAATPAPDPANPQGGEDPADDATPTPASDADPSSDPATQ